MTDKIRLAYGNRIQEGLENMLHPLISRELYDEFARLRSRMPEHGVSNLAHVFVPVGPLANDAKSSRPTILFVGRATYRYGEDRLGSYDGAAARDIEIVEDRNSPFWAFSRQIAAATLNSLGLQRSTETTDGWGWTNLAKVGDTRGNPTPLSLSLQKDLCRRALAEEIGLMKPDAVVVTTGSYAQSEILEPVFGADGWDMSDEPTRSKRSSSFDTFVIHTYHPERRAGSRAMAVHIGELISKAINQAS